MKGKNKTMAKALSPLLALAMVLSLMAAVLLPAVVLFPAPASASPAEIHVYAGESIQDAVDAADPGDTIIVHDGVYNETITINKTLTVRSDNGTAVTIINGTVNIDLGEDDAGNPMAEELVFGGAGVGFNVTYPQSGINVDKVLHGSSLTIEDNIITGNSVSGIYVYQVEYFSYLNIINNTITNNGGDGIYIDYIQYFSYVTIAGNTITGNNAGIYVYQMYYQGYLAISDNTITDNDNDGIYIYYNNYGSRVVIGGEGNDISDNGGYGVYVYYVDYGSYLAILHNEIINNTWDGIYIDDVDDGSEVIIQGNNAISENGGDGIHVDYVDYGSFLTISDNLITDNDGDGIYNNGIDDGSEAVIHNNTISGNGGDGICIDDVVDYLSFLIISANRITDNDGDGIFVYEIEDGSVVIIGGEGNIISDNGGDGIYIDSEVCDGSILAVLDNQIINNTDDGIYIELIEYGAEVIISNNTITDNDGDGIDIYDGPDDGARVIIGGEGNDISNNGEYGIYIESYVDYGAWLFILDNRIVNNGYDGIFIESSIDDGSKVVIENNTISGNGLANMSEEGYGIAIDGVDYGGYLAILANVITNNAYDGIWIGYIDDGSDVIIGGEGNIIRDNRGYGIRIEDYIDYGSRLTILDNQIINNTEDGIYIYYIDYGSDVVIQNNSILENAYGINIPDYVEDGSLLAILANEISNNAKDAVYIEYVDDGSYILIQDNNAIQANDGTGINITDMESGAKLALINNLIVDNNGNGGVYVGEITDGCEIWVLSNNITANEGAGLWFNWTALSMVTIKGNTFLGNDDEGIYLWMEDSWVTIWSNDILNNTDGVVVNGTRGVVTAHENNIDGNTASGVTNAQPNVTVNATNSWWGAASGPSGVGPGTGDSVSANVNYTPWLNGTVVLMITVRALFNFEVPGIVDAIADTDTLVTFSDTGHVSGFIGIDKITPPAEAANFTADTNATALKFIAVQIWDFDTGIAHIELHYTSAEFAAVRVSPCSLLLYYWNGTAWVECDNSGVDISNQIVYGDIPVSALYAADPPVAAGGQPANESGLEVVITSPATSTDITVGNCFTVTATVTNIGVANATNVTATISIDANASLIAIEPATKALGNISSCGNATVSWIVRCDSVGDSTITVNATGNATDDNCTYPIPDVNITPDSVTVHQQKAGPAELAVLEVVITSPTDCTEFTVCQNFTVNVTVNNIGAASASSVTATIDPGATASLVAGETATKATTPATIPSGGSATVSWELHCDGSGDSTITVNATGADVTLAIPDRVTVRQQMEALLAVEITAPDDCTNFTTCQDFTVHVTVSNNGGATATSVTATISIDANASLKAGEAATKATTPATIPGGGSATVSWNLHCDSVGDSVITVTAAGIDANTGEEIDNIEPDTVTVHQQAVPLAVLKVVITSPTDCAEFTPCQNFNANATVSNTGAADALNVNVTISIDAHASLVEGETATKALGNISSGGNATVSWELHCDSVGDSTITVNATGTDANTGLAIPVANIVPDTVTVDQQEVAPTEGLSGGAVAGIAIGVAAAAFLLGFLAARWKKKEE